MKCLLTSKSEKIYDYTFLEFKKLVDALNIDFSNRKFMSDFEISLRNPITKNFPHSELMGCYFHYVKNLFTKFKKLGLCTKNSSKETTKFLFFLNYTLLSKTIIKKIL